MTAARKQRVYRQRKRAGLAAYRVVLPPNEAVLALIAAGRLSEAEALDRGAVERELAIVLAEWSAQWLRIKCYR